MKKENSKGKLSLNKETIAKLNDDQMSNIIGGATQSQASRCCTYTATEVCCNVTIDWYGCLTVTID